MYLLAKTRVLMKNGLSSPIMSDTFREAWKVVKNENPREPKDEPIDVDGEPGGPRYGGPGMPYTHGSDEDFWIPMHGQARSYLGDRNAPEFVQCADCGNPVPSWIEHPSTVMEGHDGVWADCSEGECGTITGSDGPHDPYEHHAAGLFLGTINAFLEGGQEDYVAEWIMNQYPDLDPSHLDEIVERGREKAIGMWNDISHDLELN